jgi:hypothetical protein|tara:strand:- start:555 stop:704 length:150 start_codon:yes stop_codon:yes gene_type:complete
MAGLTNKLTTSPMLERLKIKPPGGLPKNLARTMPVLGTMQQDKQIPSNI